LFTPYDMVQSEIFWVANSDAYDTSRVPVIRLFNNYFGGSMASIVFQTIRESKALAYSTYASFTGPVKKDDRYSTIAYVGTQADKLADAVKAMNELLDSLPRTEALFESAKQSIRKDIASERILDDGIIFS